MTPAKLLFASTLLALALGCGCSPEAARSRAGGLGADPGNSRLPIEMHGNQQTNNPAFEVPGRGRVPADARGVPGWWSR
ncbi:MAG TPA: hypothetical protein VHX16_05520 [Chloroflexota bacterium]|jgi:hypothetical protein|nr:hypothetical protein [Chloroflexota bacterium]